MRADHDPEWVRLLGEVLIKFADMEEDLRATLCEVVTDEDEVALILAAGIPFPAVVDKLSSLVQYRLRHIIDWQRFTELCTRLQRLNDRRNVLVHSSWAVNLDTGETYRDRIIARRKGGLRWEGETISKETLEALLSEIDETASQVWDLVDQSMAVWKSANKTIPDST